MEDFDNIQCEEYEPDWYKYGYPSEQAFLDELYAEQSD
jgi:hypothetical protein